MMIHNISRKQQYAVTQWCCLSCAACLSMKQQEQH